MKFLKEIHLFQNFNEMNELIEDKNIKLLKDLTKKITIYSFSSINIE